MTQFFEITFVWVLNLVHITRTLMVFEFPLEEHPKLPFVTS